MILTDYPNSFCALLTSVSLFKSIVSRHFSNSAHAQKLHTSEDKNAVEDDEKAML